MPEVLLKELDPRWRKQFANAKVAVERGNCEYAVEICSTLLLEHPGCLEVRRLLRQAQQSVFAAKASGALGRAKASAAAKLRVVYGKPYLKKKPEVAMDYGEKALAMDPFCKSALSLVAEGAEALELHETAVFCLRSVCDGDCKDFELLRRYCEALINVGETNQAVTIAERLKKLKPESSIIQELVKSASVAHSIHKGKWADEEQDYRSKLKDEELSDRLERNNRLVSDEVGAKAEASELIEAISQDPQNLDLYKRLVKAFIVAQEFRVALSWLDKATLLPQGASDVTVKQLRSDVMIQATERELQLLHQDIERAGTTGGKAKERIQKLERELDALRLEESRKMVEQFPNDFAQRLNYGELLLQSGKVDESIKEFQVALRSSSLRHRASVLLGKCFHKKGLFDLALERFDNAVAEMPGMDETKKDVLYHAASCCDALGRSSEAIDRYKQIYASDISFRDVAQKIDEHYSSGR